MVKLQVFVLLEECLKQVLKLFEEGGCQVLEFLCSSEGRTFLGGFILRGFIIVGLTGLSEGDSADHVADGEVVEVFLVVVYFGGKDDRAGGGLVDFVAGLEAEVFVSGVGRPPGGVEVGHGRAPFYCLFGDDKSVPLHAAGNYLAVLILYYGMGYRRTDCRNHETGKR